MFCYVTFKLPIDVSQLVRIIWFSFIKRFGHTIKLWYCLCCRASWVTLKSLTCSLPLNLKIDEILMSEIIIKWNKWKSDILHYVFIGNIHQIVPKKTRLFPFFHERSKPAPVTLILPILIDYSSACTFMKIKRQFCPSYGWPRMKILGQQYKGF